MKVAQGFTKVLVMAGRLRFGMGISPRLAQHLAVRGQAKGPHAHCEGQDHACTLLSCLLHSVSGSTCKGCSGN